MCKPFRQKKSIVSIEVARKNHLGEDETYLKSGPITATYRSGEIVEFQVFWTAAEFDSLTPEIRKGKSIDP